MKVYELLYNECIYESAFDTISIHSTIKGASKEMLRIKEERWGDLFFGPIRDYERFKYRITQVKS